jgi:PAS domain S-box-containing protein
VQENLAHIFWHLPNAIAVLDRDLKYLAYSKKWLEDYGLEGDLIGRSHYEVFPEIGEEWKKIHQDCLQGKQMKQDVDRFERTDGSVQWLRWEIHPWEVDGVVEGIIMSTEDITELKNIQDKLLDSKKVFDKFMTNLPVLIWMKDSDLKYIYVNEFFKEKFNMQDADIIGKRDEDFMKPESAKYCLQSDLDAFKSSSSVSSIERSADPNSFYEYMMTIKFRIPNSDGNTYLGGVGVDISDVRK